MKLVEKYSNCFKKIYQKVDLNIKILVANIIKQYLNGLSFAITSMIYIRTLANLQITINNPVNIFNFKPRSRNRRSYQ